jgi:hypothetical protein
MLIAGVRAGYYYGTSACQLTGDSKYIDVWKEVCIMGLMDEPERRSFLCATCLRQMGNISDENGLELHVAQPTSHDWLPLLAITFMGKAAMEFG